jgi:hypothetical protein
MGRTCVRITSAMVVVAGLGAGIAIAQTPAAEGWVVLPVDEYRALRERGRPPAPPPISAVDATLTRVDYELRLENEAIVGRALLTADVLRDGWARVAVPAGLMAREARLDGQRVALVEGPPPYVLLSRAGRAAVALDIAVPVTSAAGADAITLPASPSPISRVSLQLPPGLAITQVNGSTVADWTVTPAGLQVGLLEPTASDTQFVVQGEIRAARDGEIVIPLVRVPLAEREVGGVVVDVVGAGEIAGRQSRNLEPADPSELGDVISGRESPSMIIAS